MKTIIIWLNAIGVILIFVATLGFTVWLYSKNIKINKTNKEISNISHQIDFQMTVLLNYQNMDIQAAINDLGIKLLKNEEYENRYRTTLMFTLNMLAPKKYTIESMKKFSNKQLMEKRPDAYDIFNSKYKNLKATKHSKEELRDSLIKKRDKIYPLFGLSQVGGILLLSLAKILELVIKT